MRYDSATRPCSGGPTRGIKELEYWILHHIAATSSYGTYNCRSVRGSFAPSMHGSGRAVDIHPANNSVAVGNQVANLMVAHAESLGVQCVIWNRQIWSSKSPKWRRYFGVNAHIDHVHIEITIPAATFLNQAYINSVVGGHGAPPSSFTVLKEGDRGEAVKAWQLCLVVYFSQKIKVDGVFGSATTAATKLFQGFSGLPQDGQVGPKTHQAMAWMMAQHKQAKEKVKVKPQYDPPQVLEPIVASCAGPSGKGSYLLGQSGAVYAFGGARYKGGANGKAFFKGRKAAKIRLATAAEKRKRLTYVITATTGETYKF